MSKTLWIIVASAVLGAALGAGISWANFSHSPPLQTQVASQAASADGKQPKVLVDHLAHDFGPLERDVTVSHVFRFTNLGDATLELKAGRTSCTACTIATLAKPRLAPGESTDVTVEYKTNYYKPVFHQYATVLTNDPEQPRVELNIYGSVTSNFFTLPEVLSFSKVSAGETKTEELKVFSRLSDSLELASYQWVKAETASFFDVRSEPIPRADLDQSLAKSGCRLFVTLKPGLPLGPVQQTIRLSLTVSGNPEPVALTVNVDAMVDSDISVVGAKWNPSANKLSIGAVKGAEGTTRELLLLLRGPHRDEVTIKPVEVYPEWLKVTLGEKSELASGAVNQIPMSIEIPPGSPAGSYAGTSFHKFGKIVLETTHPEMKQIKLFLQFIIE